MVSWPGLAKIKKASVSVFTSKVASVFKFRIIDSRVSNEQRAERKGSDLILFSLRLQTYFAPLRETKRSSKSRFRAKAQRATKDAKFKIGHYQLKVLV